MKNSIITVLIATCTLANIQAKAEQIYYNDFSEGLGEQKTKRTYQKGSLKTSDNRRKWVASQDWNFFQASIIEMGSDHIPPMDSSGGAAALLNSGHSSIVLEETWNKNKTYTLTIKSIITKKGGKKGSNQTGTFQLAAAAFDPNGGETKWVESLPKKQETLATTWTETSVKIKPSEILPAHHGKRIVIRLARLNIPSGMQLWFDSVQLECEDPENHNNESIQNIWSQQPSKKKKPTKANLSFERKARYIAAQAGKKFSLDSAQQELTYKTVYMYIQCRTEINKIAKDGDIDKATKLAPMVKKAYQKSMLEIIGEDKFIQLDQFNKETSSFLK